MPENDTAAAVTPKKARQRRAKAATARSGRHSYKAEADTLRAENERLKSRITRLEARPESSFESSLILKASESSFRAGVETGLMLQGASK